MARIRTIKPEFWTSEQVAECSTNARLLFIGLWNFCDDFGIHPASIKRLKMEIFPSDSFTDDEISKWVAELISADLLISYVVDGKEFWSVTGWRHQKIERPSARYPKPPEQQEFDERSSNGRRGIDDESSSDHPRKGSEQGSGSGTGQGTGGGGGTGRESKGSFQGQTVRTGSARAREESSPPDLTLSDLGNAFGEDGDAIVERASSLFRRAKYQGSDGRVFWQAAVLEVRRKIPGYVAESAANACKEVRPPVKNPPAYFRTTIIELCGKHGKDFKALAALVTFPAGMKFGPPSVSGPADLAAEFAAASKVPDEDLHEAKRQRLQEQLNERRRKP